MRWCFTSKHALSTRLSCDRCVPYALRGLVYIYNEARGGGGGGWSLGKMDTCSTSLLKKRVRCQKQIPQRNMSRKKEEPNVERWAWWGILGGGCGHGAKVETWREQ